MNDLNFDLKLQLAEYFFNQYEGTFYKILKIDKSLYPALLYIIRKYRSKPESAERKFRQTFKYLFHPNPDSRENAFIDIYDLVAQIVPPERFKFNLDRLYKYAYKYDVDRQGYKDIIDSIAFQIAVFDHTTGQDRFRYLLDAHEKYYGEPVSSKNLNDIPGNNITDRIIEEYAHKYYSHDEVDRIINTDPENF